MQSLIVPLDVRMNADHLKRVNNETLQVVIDEVHIVFIAPYLIGASDFKKEQLTVIEKYLTQHMVTLNVRRPDSEGLAGQLTKSVSVVKGKDLEQTEYGQMAKKIGKMLGLEWANEVVEGLKEARVDFF